MASESPTANTVTVGILAGLLGAGLALLFAPTDGREMRNKIKRSAARSQDIASDTAQEAADHARASLEEMSNRLENIQEEMRLRRERKRQSPVLTNWEEEV